MTAVSHRRIAKGALALAASRAMVFMVPLAATPVFSRIFDDKTFGAWTILASLFSLLGVQDLGICSALRVRIAELQVSGDDTEARREFLSVFVLLLVGAIVASAVVWFLHPPVNFLGLLPAQSGAAYLAFSMGLISVASAPSFHTLYAYLETEWVAAADVIRAALQVLAAGLVYVTTARLVPSLIVFFSPWLLYVFHTYFIVLRRRNWRGIIGTPLRNWWAGRKVLEKLILDGMPFWALQLLNLTFGPVDVLLAGKFLGLAQTGSLGLVLRLLNVGYAVLGAAGWGYAGAYGLQYARGDYGWVKRTSAIATGLMVAAGLVATVGLVWLGEPVIRIWSGRTVAMPGVYFMAGIVFLTGGVGLLLLSVLQSIGRVGRVLVPLTVLAALKIGLAIVVIPIWHADGLLAVSSLCNLAVAGAAALELARLLRTPPAREVPSV